MSIWLYQIIGTCVTDFKNDPCEKCLPRVFLIAYIFLSIAKTVQIIRHVKHKSYNKSNQAKKINKTSKV